MHKAGLRNGGIAGQRETWLSEALGLSQGADTSGEEYQRKGLPREGQVWVKPEGAKPTCVVHHTRLSLLGKCPSCKET